MGLTNWERIQFIWRTFMLLSLGSSDGLPKLYSKFHIIWHIMLTWFIWLIPYIYIYISLGNQYILLNSIVYISGKEAGSKHWNYKERDGGANWSWNWAQAKAWSDDWSFNSETSPGLSSNILDNSVDDFLYLFLFDEWGPYDTSGF